uniref:Uncharacterized protein n=1 Tax=Panagrolaimus sp. JU765 TaxID=591449 RepID=A0AC34R364_9BILA
MQLTPLGTEFEAILAAVLVFILGGVLMFLCCFVVTHIYLFYKKRTFRKKRRHDRLVEDAAGTVNHANSRQFSYAPLQAEQNSSEQSSEKNMRV